jgi:hypothetical protein
MVLAALSLIVLMSLVSGCILRAFASLDGDDGRCWSTKCFKLASMEERENRSLRRDKSRI